MVGKNSFNDIFIIFLSNLRGEAMSLPGFSLKNSSGFFKIFVRCYFLDECLARLDGKPQESRAEAFLKRP
jgi:hypothetical protein